MTRSSRRWRPPAGPPCRHRSARSGLSGGRGGGGGLGLGFRVTPGALNSIDSSSESKVSLMGAYYFSKDGYTFLGVASAVSLQRVRKTSCLMNLVQKAEVRLSHPHYATEETLADATAHALAKRPPPDHVVPPENPRGTQRSLGCSPLD